MKCRDWKKGTMLCALCILATTLAAGCSIAGKRVTDNGWQVTLVNGRPFEEGDGKYLFAIYDGNLPVDSISVLQLWSGPPE